MTRCSDMINTVIFDFGGVITSSPFEAFARFEQQRQLPKDFIRTVNSTNPDDNAWAKLENSDVTREEFDGLFAAESRALGHEIAGADVLALLSGELRPEMVKALSIIGQHYKTGCITNNIRRDQSERVEAITTRFEEVMTSFDIVIESSIVGIRKPNPEIYKLACHELGVQPNEAVFLDDLGINLKPARALGMKTIKVMSGDQALTDLEAILERRLR